MLSEKEAVVFDIEIIGKGEDVFFFFGARHLPSGKVIAVSGAGPEDLDRIAALMRNPKYVWVSFNGNKFDIPVLAAILSGRSLGDAKRMANHIITTNAPAWMSFRDAGVERPDIDHIDLMETAPGVMISLKLYAARLGLKSIVDLPFEHDAILDEKQREMVADYCLNGDLVATAALFNELQQQIELREKMGEEYGLDLRSKSDAQMAEWIIAKQLGIKGAVEVPAKVRYKAPPFIQPRNMVLVDMLERAQRHDFKVSKANGAVEMPPFLEEPILLGKGRYQMGIGGLHSQHDRCQQWVASADLEISDFDVASFYPNMILNAGLIPRGIGLPFLHLYRKLLDERIVAKRTGNKVKNEGMKIMLNGTFGKLGSMFSKLYAPDLMIATTLTGQFYLLGLIELVIENGGHVISANTDGICVGASPADMAMIRDVVAMYGWLTSFEFEETKYRSISIRDVNSYCAVTLGGKVKVKGAFSGGGLMTNPSNNVCTLAAQAYLSTGRSIESFIREHLKPENFADFTQSRSVTGGAVAYTAVKEVDDWINLERGAWYRQAWYDMGKVRKPLKRVSRPDPVMSGDNPVFLGRVARWYYSTDKNRSIHYFNNDNQVPKATASTACLKLPDTIPADLDLDRYIEETKVLLRSAGVPV